MNQYIVSLVLNGNEYNMNVKTDFKRKRFGYLGNPDRTPYGSKSRDMKSARKVKRGKAAQKKA